MSLDEKIPGLTNGRSPLPWLVTAGQPSLNQIEAAQAAGVTMIIDLRDPMEERPFHEPEEAARLGIEYVNVPVSLGSLDEEKLDRILAALRSNAGQPTMLHCASANRVGGALIPYFILDEGMDRQQAVDLATKVGLRSAELMEWGLDYAAKRGS